MTSSTALVQQFESTSLSYNPVAAAQQLVARLNLEDHYGGPQGLALTADTLSFLDIGDGQPGSGYGPVGMDNGVFTAKHSPQHLLQVFPVIALDRWLKGYRPSLPGLAVGVLKNLGIDVSNFENDPNVTEEEKALTRALLLVSLRAEYIKGQPRGPQSWKEANFYHNAGHVSHVAVMSHYLMDLTAHHPGVKVPRLSSQAFTRADRLAQVLDGFAHDVDHPGMNNPANDRVYRVYNERRSVDVIRPLLEAAGVSQDRICQSAARIFGTSPNEMIGGLKSALEEINKAAPDLKKLHVIAESFPELGPLLEGTDLTVIQKRLEMAAILNDADLFGSAGCGMEANKFLSDLLTKEVQKSGGNMNFTSDGARKYFLQNIVGARGFGSQAGTVGFNENFYALLDATLTNMGLAPKHAAFQAQVEKRLTPPAVSPGSGSAPAVPPGP